PVGRPDVAGRVARLQGVRTEGSLQVDSRGVVAPGPSAGQCQGARQRGWRRGGDASGGVIKYLRPRGIWVYEAVNPRFSPEKQGLDAANNYAFTKVVAAAPV